MLSRLLTNLILLVIVVTLGIFIYVSRDDDVVSHRLTGIDASTINRIGITHNGRTLELKKFDNHWRMLKPIAVDANDFRIKSLLDLLSTESFSDYDATGLALKPLGLDQPETTIQYNDLLISFGIDNPVNHHRYVLVNNHVHMISDQFYPLISSQIGTLVSQNLLPRDAVITGMDLPDQTLRKSDIGWQSSDISVSTDAIEKTLDQWRHAQAFGVHTYNPRKSLGRIEVSIDSEDRPLVFEITDKDPWLIIARPDLSLEYHFNLELYDRLLQPGVEPETDTTGQQSTPPASSN